MNYLMDTVAIVRHLSGNTKIGKKAAKILNSTDTSDHTLFLSTVSLMEILYLSEKHRIPITLKETLDSLNTSSIYQIVNLTPEILIVAEKVAFFELHDRLILATAKWLDVPIISSDRRFAEVEGLTTIWG